MKLRPIYLLSAGHLSTDISQGALPAILPFLKDAHQLNYTQIGGLVFAMSVASSVVQPIFGYYADRISLPWLMPVGLLLTGLGMSLVGVAPSYWTILLVVSICGVGVAAFHPEAARLANRVSGENKATAMSIFSFGGNAGFALGPLLMAGVLALLKMPGTLLLALPCLCIALLLVLRASAFTVPAPATGGKAGLAAAAPVPDQWGAFSWLTVAIICRSVMFYGLLTFLPLYWIHTLRQSKEIAWLPLTILFSIGALSTLLGGRIADRMGYRKIMKLGFGLLIPLFFLFLHYPTVIVATALLIPIALTFYSPFSAMVVLGQQYLPNRIGLSSGVTLGLSVSIGGAMAPLLGRLADTHGIHAALLVVAVLPILAVLVSLTLPAPRLPQAAVVAAESIKQDASVETPA